MERDLSNNPSHPKTQQCPIEHCRSRSIYVHVGYTRDYSSNFEGYLQPKGFMKYVLKVFLIFRPVGVTTLYVKCEHAYRPSTIDEESM